MLNYLKAYRPLNILFIALAQWLASYYLDFSASRESIKLGGVYYLILGTAACAAFGYWTNDYFDVIRDRINKPGKNWVGRLNKYAIWSHLLLFISIALYCGNALGVWFVGLFIITLITLVVYNIWLKDIAGIGNVLIGALSFISIYCIQFLFKEVDKLLLLHFATLAGMLNFSREIVKDAEDLKGDSESGANTLPIVFGIRNANLVVYVILLFTISFMVVSLINQNQYLAKPINYLYFMYYAFFVILPLYYVAVEVRYAKEKSKYAYISKVLKYVMFTGILSILFF